ncbi:MAG: hypothetical protein AAGF83_17380 [Cyanobacteria bacterium P01_G01_bin.67]
MNQQLKLQINSFFDYWRERYQFIDNLDLIRNNYEANVLLWAAFDALSNLWADSIIKNRKIKGKKLRFDAFLASYGGEIFQIVSLPDIWDRVDKKSIELPPDVCTFLGQIGGRQEPGGIDIYQLRHSSDDCSSNKIIDTILEKYPVTNVEALEKSLKLSRYGSIAYKEMRNAYIHEESPGINTHNFDLYESGIRPTYLSGLYVTPPAIGFKVEFMLNILKLCIDKFEKEALSLKIDPIPERFK